MICMVSNRTPAQGFQRSNGIPKQESDFGTETNVAQTSERKIPIQLGTNMFRHSHFGDFLSLGPLFCEFKYKERMNKCDLGK